MPFFGFITIAIKTCHMRPVDIARLSWRPQVSLSSHPSFNSSVPSVSLPPERRCCCRTPTILSHATLTAHVISRVSCLAFIQFIVLSFSIVITHCGVLLKKNFNFTFVWLRVCINSIGDLVGKLCCRFLLLNDTFYLRAVNYLLTYLLT